MVKKWENNVIKTNFECYNGNIKTTKNIPYCMKYKPFTISALCEVHQ